MRMTFPPRQLIFVELCRTGALLGALLALGAPFTACSAGSGSGGRTAGVVASGGGAATNGAGSGGVPAIFVGSGASANDPGVITIGGQGGVGVAPVQPGIDAGTSSGRTPISIDACGAGNAANLSATD